MTYLFENSNGTTFYQSGTRLRATTCCLEVIWKRKERKIANACRKCFQYDRMQDKLEMSTHYKNTKEKNHLVENDFRKHTALPNLSYTQTLRLNYF